ncbi:MAG: hypothetical protein Q9160_000593 [Pyrenula sp. 1 TL-2023]
MTLINYLTGSELTKKFDRPTGNAIYSLQIALGTIESKYKRKMNEMNESSTEAVQKAVSTWLHAHRAFLVQGKPIEQWLKPGIFFRFWIRACISWTGQILIFLFCLLLALLMGFSLFRLDRFLRKLDPDTDHDLFGYVLWTILLVFWTLIFSPMLIYLLMNGLVQYADFIADTTKEFEKRLADFASKSKRFLVSDRGFLGTTNAAANPGDEICFLVGCSDAVILRKQVEGSEGLGAMSPRYHVVGTVNVRLSSSDEIQYGCFPYNANNYGDFGSFARQGGQWLLQEFDLI